MSCFFSEAHHDSRYLSDPTTWFIFLTVPERLTGDCPATPTYFVEAGFSVAQARKVLATTQGGMDMQATLKNLLNSYGGEYNSLPPQRPPYLRSFCTQSKNVSQPSFYRGRHFFIVIFPSFRPLLLPPFYLQFPHAKHLAEAFQLVRHASASDAYLSMSWGPHNVVHPSGYDSTMTAKRIVEHCPRSCITDGLCVELSALGSQSLGAPHPVSFIALCIKPVSSKYLNP